jgi:TorA maturation chaperone TorD
MTISPPDPRGASLRQSVRREAVPRFESPLILPPEEQARADLYALAARLLLAPPDDDLLAALAGAEGLAGHSSESRLDVEWEHLAQAAGAMPAELVASEYAALFEGVGSPLIDPYASVYLSGFMMEKPLARLRTDLAALGLASTGHAGLPEDHLGALCETMRLLIAGAPGFDPQPVPRQRAFFERHLGAWTERCLDEIAHAEPANFYRRVAGFVRALLAVERGAFELTESDDGDDGDDGDQGGGNGDDGNHRPPGRPGNGRGPCPPPLHGNACATPRFDKSCKEAVT